ncbi:MAG: hypothetical protein NT022_11015 [Deltaproteobacteria bacterium]|nr:hypothetical protein [Deltaproteobacteria bacterium]
MNDGNIPIRVDGRIVRVGRLKTEYFESLEAPVDYIDYLKKTRLKADIFTFLQNVADIEPHYGYMRRYDSLAMMSITSYEHWWKSQINDKTRNMIRRAQKAGVQVRITEFNDDFVKGIKGIYDESSFRQGIPFKHYGKDVETLRAGHATFIERSEFVGAYDGDELIGFIKLVHDKGFSSLMQIISKTSSRNKAPTNALIAKAVEICSQKNILLLMYGVWSQRGLGDFKKHHAFQRHDVPRYFVPLTVWGKVAQKLGFQRRLKDRLPEDFVEFAVGFRKRWYSHRTRRRA